MNTFNILLADDDQDDRELFCEALEDMEEISVSSTENGKKALDVLNAGNVQPNMIFLDINMPIMNGWEALSAIKSQEKLSGIPVVIYSSSSHQQDHDRALQNGAASFFTKPSNFNEFRSKLIDLVKRYS